MPLMSDSRPRLLIFIPAFEAALHIEWVISRIPHNLAENFDPYVLVIDDASSDATAALAQRALERSKCPYEFTVLANPRNRGYGGNQKLGYQYAIDRGFDVVVMVHGDGQYPPESTEELASAALRTGAAFGSRFGVKGDAVKGGMPRYKWIGNRVLTTLQNWFLHTDLTEFHSGFRAYTTAALRKIPFSINSDDFHFDTEIFIQLNRAGVAIGEINIPTHYGTEECRVNGVSYAVHVMLETFKSALHDKGLFYEMKLDVKGSQPGYESKLTFDSPSTRVSAAVIPHSTVLDLGCSSGHLAVQLAEQGCTVIGVDLEEPSDSSAFTEFYERDLNDGVPEIEGTVDVVLMLDVIEHLASPEQFVRQLSDFCAEHRVSQVFVSTGNVAFIIQRLALMVGQFNYGARGILDMTHTRLFTFRTIKRLFRQSGFVIERTQGIPVPVPLAIGSNGMSTALMTLNRALIRVAPRLFSYQILLQMRPPAQLAQLLDQSAAHATTLVKGAQSGTVQPEAAASHTHSDLRENRLG